MLAWMLSDIDASHTHLQCSAAAVQRPHHQSFAVPRLCLLNSTAISQSTCTLLFRVGLVLAHNAPSRIQEVAARIARLRSILCPSSPCTLNM